MAGPDRIVCILGMHRSGTSCLTGSLQKAGLYLGNCHTWNRHNRKGNRENQAFVDLNDAVLAANDGAWDRPPLKARWLAAHEQRARSLLSSQGAVPVFGFKDPRTLLVLDGWKRVRDDLQFLAVVRHPDAVARSLYNRSRIPRDRSIELWRSYNEIILREFRRRPFPILCFDDDEADFNRKLDQVAASIGLPGASTNERFYDSELKTNDIGEHRLPWRLRRLYARLREVCL